MLNDGVSAIKESQITLHLNKDWNN